MDHLIDERAAEYLADEYNPSKYNNFVETIQELDNADHIAYIEQMLAERNFEALGRKLWAINVERWELLADRKACNDYNMELIER